MKYKAFQDFYKEATINHLLLEEYQGQLVSPPFSTNNSKEYSKLAVFDRQYNRSFIELDIPKVTSKFNATAVINNSLWLIPYGIWDDCNVVVEINNYTPTYHTINKPGKGQFYSVASNGTTACSFPLGYSDTNYILYIDNNGIHTIDYNTDNTKCHMGVVYCNERYWSMPRGDNPNYNSLVSFDGNTVQSFSVPVTPDVTRKFSDIVVVGHTLYSLPFGETKGLTDIVSFDTDTLEFNLYPTNIPDFAKKYNTQVLLDNCIIGLPYGDEHANNSNLGIIFDIDTKETRSIDIGLSFGGKYRYRSGIVYDNSVWFFPSGTPSCPIIKVNKDGIQEVKYFKDTLFGRPIIYNNTLHIIGHTLTTSTEHIYIFNTDMTCEIKTAI